MPIYTFGAREVAVTCVVTHTSANEKHVGVVSVRNVRHLLTATRPVEVDGRHLECAIIYQYGHRVTIVNCGFLPIYRHLCPNLPA